MPRITVQHRYGASFDVSVRGYSLISDEPVVLGGEDAGPTPTELVVAGIAACTADEAMRWLADRGLPYDAATTTADFEWNETGDRISGIDVQVHVPADLAAADREALLKAVERCPARLLITQPPRLGFAVRPLKAAGVAAERAEEWPFEPPPDADSE